MKTKLSDLWLLLKVVLIVWVGFHLIQRAVAVKNQQLETKFRIELNEKNE